MNSKPTGLMTQISTRQALLVGALVLLVGGGAWALWRHIQNSPPAWLVRWQVSQHLKKQARTSNFEVSFPFPSKAEMARSPGDVAANPPPAKGSRTGKDFDALSAQYLRLKESVLALERQIPASTSELSNAGPRLDRLTQQLERARASGSTNTAGLEQQVQNLQRRVALLQTNAAAAPELKRKQEALDPITADLWEFQRYWDQSMQAAESSGVAQVTRARDELLGETRSEIGAATTYTVIYKVIGQQIWVAKRLLNSANPAHQRVGLALALNASRHALDDAIDGWLAARIVEGYIWPHLGLANDPNRRSPFNLDNLVNECADIYRQNDEFATVVRSYKVLLAKADSPQRADAMRAQIAMIHEQSGEFQEAIDYLRQIKLTNDFSWALRRIPRIERQMQRGR